MKQQKVNYLNEIQDFLRNENIRLVFSRPTFQFVIKAGSIIFFIWIFLSFFLVQATYSLKKVKFFQNEVVQIYLKGAIQNPAALWRSSVIHEEHEKYTQAILDMELAIGLLEMHRAPDEMKKAYKDRLSHLMSIK